MTSLDLLEVIGSIRNSYILEAKKVSETKETKKLNHTDSHPMEKPLPFQTEEAPRYYQTSCSKEQKKNGLKRFLVLSAAAGLLLAVLAGRGTIAGWADYFETFLNRTENQYQYTQPTETIDAFTETTMAQLETTEAYMETTVTQSGPNYLKTAQENLISVLSGEETFFSHSYGRNLTIDEYCAAFGEESGVTVKITKYAAADMDQDAVPEIILWITVNEYSDYGTVVLRYQNDNVEEYTFSYRQLFELKQDGTFSVSGSEYDGPCSLTFDGDGWHYVEISDQQQDAKEGVVWYSYPSDGYLDLFKK